MMEARSLKMDKLGWIGVDLDGTLAYYDEWDDVDCIGAPVQAMVQRVKDWLAEGVTVKVFTARVAFPCDRDFVEIQTRKIQDWCEKYIGQKLDVTCVKDFAMLELWDDRCVRVLVNTGRPLPGDPHI
jgi:hypothetical protein